MKKKYFRIFYNNFSFWKLLFHATIFSSDTYLNSKTSALVLGTQCYKLTIQMRMYRLGFYVKNMNNPFNIWYCRLMLTLTPCVCILAAIAFSKLFSIYLKVTFSIFIKVFSFISGVYIFFEKFLPSLKLFSWPLYSGNFCAMCQTFLVCCLEVGKQTIGSAFQFEILYC